MSELVLFRDGAPKWLHRTGPYHHTLDKVDLAAKKKLYRAVVSSEFTFEELVGQRISVEHFVVHPTARVDETTGESRDALRIVAISPDGTRVSGGSETVLRCLLMAAEMSDREPPWNPPLQFLIVAEPRKGAPGKWLWLDWVE